MESHVSPSSDVNWYGTNPYIPGMIYATEDTPDTYSDRAYFSTDAGNSWQLMSTTGCYFNPRFFFSTPPQQLAYMAACGGGIYYSSDNGKSWNECKGFIYSGTDTSLAIDPRDDSHLYGASFGEGVLISHNACQSWQPSSRGINTLFINSIAIDPNNPDTIYAGTQSGAYVSIDGGTNWQEINDGLLGATVIYSIVVDKSSNVFAAAPYGIYRIQNN